MRRLLKVKKAKIKIIMANIVKSAYDKSRHRFLNPFKI